MTEHPAPLPSRTELRRQTRSQRRLSGTQKALVGLLVLILVLLAGATAAFFGIRHSINSQIRHVEVSVSTPASPHTTQSAPQSESSGPGTTFLILGSDSRLSGGDPRNWQAGAQRSDVLIVAQITADGKGINVMSIPRDSWVDIPGYGTAKINAAFSYGGADLTIATVENLLGIHIDHFMITDFTSFSELTDALGGVTLDTSTGPKTMTGSEALAFVRERHSLPRGDFDRMQRQQAWMRAILKKTFSQSLLTNPAKLAQLVSIVTTYSALDQNLTFDSLLAIASGLTGLRSSGVLFFTIPYLGTGTSQDGQSIVELDTAALPELSRAWQSGTISDYVAQHPNLDSLP